VKACSYCGRKNDDEARHCFECGTEFSAPPAAKNEDAPVEVVASESAIALSQLDMGFVFTEGFSRPNWEAIAAYVKNKIPQEDWSAAWSLIGSQWLAQLAKDLGGASRVHRSDNFLCLSDLEPGVTQTLLDYAESTLGSIRSILKEAAWQGYYGKHVLLLFSDQDDYFSYISYYYPEGSHALSWGVCLARGYIHVALPYTGTLSVERVLAHELVHNLLCHLRIPNWLNEGLAVSIEGRVSHGRFLVDRELIDRHAGFWTEENIQSFWAGKSFHTPGEESELSYSLGQILVGLLAEKGEDFIPFIMNADWRDGGQAAALSILDCNLGDVVSGILGPGNWRPKRKAIAELFRRKVTGDLDDTIADCTKAIEFDPEDAKAYAGRGSAKCKKGDLEGALADFNKAIELHAGLVSAYCGRGLVQSGRGEFDSAIGDFNKAIELKLDDAGAYDGRGGARKAKSDFAGALVDYNKAIALNPKSAAAYYSRGCLHHDAHDFEAALVDFRKVLELEPMEDSARFRVWLVRSQLGEVEAATRELQNFLAVRPIPTQDDWASKVGYFLAGQLAEPEFLFAAKNANQKTEADQLCEAYFYAGSKLLLAGDKIAAADCFRKSVATDMKTHLGYGSATAELRFLRENRN